MTEMTSIDLLSSCGSISKTFRKHSFDQPLGDSQVFLKVGTLIHVLFHNHPSLIIYAIPPFLALTALSTLAKEKLKDDDKMSLNNHSSGPSNCH